MNSNLAGFKRSSYCGDPRPADIGQRVSVCGWVQRIRDLGGLIFIDLRDRTGIVQLVFDDTTERAIFEAASGVRSEFVIGAVGAVRERDSKNDDIPTGHVEILVDELRVFSKAETTPFEILDDHEVGDVLRLKYRYLDLRRPGMQRVLAMRHRICQIVRQYYDSHGFLEIETPILTKSTPEGARDYLVPSRVHPGSFYALPQSPQQYKQLLMLSGCDRYFQIVRCFRDEDLRADRQPEFTQIDLEMSFVDADDVMEINEGLVKELFSKVLGADIQTPFPRMSYNDAMTRFGSDKPDLRFGIELRDITDIARTCAFKVFSGSAESGGVRMICVPGGAKFTRKEIDALTDHVKTYKAGGLAWLKLSGGEMTSSFAKFLEKSEVDAIIERAGAGDGDIIFVVAHGDDEITMTALGALRLECARRLELLRPDDYKFLWVNEFPLFEYSEEEDRLVAKHHPFTSPMDEDMDTMESNPKECRAKAYDLVLNGTELGGGSIRIHSTELQKRMFRALGMDDATVQSMFGHLLEAFRFGAPPHGGMAYGLDRLVMLMTGATSIRDVMAFPKVQNASELMTACPSEVAPEQLRELGIKLDI